MTEVYRLAEMNSLQRERADEQIWNSDHLFEDAS